MSEPAPDIPFDVLFPDRVIPGRTLRLLPALSDRVHVCADERDRIHLVAEVTGNRARLFLELGRVIALLRGALDPAALFHGERSLRGSIEPAVHLLSLRTFPREPFLGLGAGTIQVVLLGGDRANLHVRRRERWFDVEDRTPESPARAEGLSPEEQLFFDRLGREYRAAR
ncbi:MAG: hypothetical protein HKN20_06890 [Gemmatimonadetes bacterium]|nr:hypothetical protein [Gemmatimonadota bacterium]